MILHDVWKIKEQKSQLTKDMTTAQLNEYFADSLLEFSKITGKSLTKKEHGYIRGADYYKSGSCQET
jgi:hypothetical protein